MTLHLKKGNNFPNFDKYTILFRLILAEFHILFKQSCYTLFIIILQHFAPLDSEMVLKSLQYSAFLKSFYPPVRKKNIVRFDLHFCILKNYFIYIFFNKLSIMKSFKTLLIPCRACLLLKWF